VNAVGPGPVFTPFHQRRIAAAGETVEQDNAKAAQVRMLKPPGRAGEVAVSAGGRVADCPLTLGALD
jgi:2-hydroxycyclohexanecarboxyl-CoA dehydrogenase